MAKIEELAYVGINAESLDAWSQYAVSVLGHEISSDSDSHNLYLRMDDHHHRLIVHPSRNEPDDVAYVGWQVRTPEDMNDIAARLENAGVPVKQGSPEEAALRRVLDFVYFIDPHSGVQMEVSVGPEITFQPSYRPSRPICGYLTGALGMGHFVTYVPDIVAAENFYHDVLGFGFSDAPFIPGMGRMGSFMHCNPRHHSLAFFMNPQPRRKANHIMLEHLSLDDVGTTFDVCRELGLVKVQLGRHNNDRAFSFYAENPSGWLFEFGWGAREIDPATFAVEHYTIGGPGGAGEWGHEGLHTII